MTYAVTVTPEGGGESERLVLHTRDGHKVYVRAVDPCDPEPEPIALYEGDVLIMAEHISHMTIHTTPDGHEGFLLDQRVVPIGREPGKVLARPLQSGEVDDGRRAHVFPGEQIEIEPRIELDYVDAWEGKGVTGYVPLTPVLFTWMAIAPQPSGDRPRYLLAAARRLDLARNLFDRVDELRQRNPDGAPAVRRAVLELIGLTELGVVSLGRVVDMCVQAAQAIGATVQVPPDITSRTKTLREIRNAYEHIEDRALGKVWGSPHPDALTIFDHDRVIVDGIITYGAHQLDLATDIPLIIAAARQFLKDVAGS